MAHKSNNSPVTDEQVMHWILRVILTILPILALAYFYTGSKIYHSINRVWTLPPVHLKWYLLGMIGYLNLHPLLLILGYLIGFDSLVKTIREGYRLWDFLFTYPFWFGLIFVAEMIPWLLLTDLLKVPFFPFFKRFRTEWLNIQSYFILSLAAFLFFYIIIRVYLDTNRVRIVATQLRVSKLPATLAGLKIVHISDLQADSRTGLRKLKRYIKKVNQLKPDVVFFTGDLVTSGEKYIEQGAEMLSNIQARYGVYACLGDHDYWSNPKKISELLNQYNVITLENVNKFVRVGFDSLLATFVTNVYQQRPSLDNLNMLMGAQPRGALDIFVTHQPSAELIEMAADAGYQLFLAGHTHGGQIVFRPFGLKFTVARLENKYYTGFYWINHMLVSVNNGLGLTFAPFRYHAPAEITLITLSPGTAATNHRVTDN